MIANARFDASLARAPLNHPAAIVLRHAVRPAGETSRGAKQRAVLVVFDACCRDIRIEVTFEFGNARRFVFLAAFFVQAYPSVLSLSEVILDIHLQYRADAGEGVNHDADERAVAQARECTCVDAGEQGAPPRG
jgi:hypothetical protein